MKKYKFLQGNKIKYFQTKKFNREKTEEKQIANQKLRESQ